MNKPLQAAERVRESLLILRDELVAMAFCPVTKRPLDTSLAEAVFKINSCLYRGYKLSAEIIE